MKKTLFIVFTILACSIVNAQKKTITKKAKTTIKKTNRISFEGFDKGSMYISGGVGISNSSQGDLSSTNIKIRPQAAYFVSDNIAIGITIGYEISKLKQVVVENRNELNIGAYGRYYFTPQNNFSFFVQGGFLYINRNIENIPLTGSSVTSKISGFQIGAAPGINYFLSKHFAIETFVGILSYQTEKPSNISDAKSTNSFDLSLDISDINFGILYKF